MTLDECEELFHSVRTATQFDVLQRCFVQLLSAYEVLNFQLGPGSIYWRARRCDTSAGFAKIKDLGPPPRALCTVGRLNDANDPVLYAATREVTTLSEIDVGPGDYVHLVGYRVVNRGLLRLGFLGDYFHVYKTGQSIVGGTEPGRALTRIINNMGREAATLRTYVDAFLSGVISDKSASDIDYVRTRALMTSIFFKTPDLDGIFYPSVKDHVGMNVCIKSPVCTSELEVVCSSVIRIVKVREYGFYDYEYCCHAIGVDGEAFVMRPHDDGASHIFFSQSEDDLLEMRKRYLEMGHKGGEIVKRALKVGEEPPGSEGN